MNSNRRRQSSCTSIHRVTVVVLLFLLLFSSIIPASAVEDVEQLQVQQVQKVFELPVAEEGLKENSRGPDVHRFTLRHIYHHGTYLHPSLHRKKYIPQNTPLLILSEDGNMEPAVELVARSRMTNIQRLRDRRPSTVEPMLAAARELGYAPPSSPLSWTIDNVPGPNISDKDTVLNLANMAASAYAFNESSSEWEDLNGGFNHSSDFGWESDGLRGHIYADENNSTIVIGIKGTTKAVFTGDGTSTKDKENDNLFASCCCAQQGPLTWVQVCSCATSAYTCNKTCLVSELKDDSRYYAAARNLYSNVTVLYPNSNIWLVGHSLGGAVSGLLGLTYGLPTVTFEAVPDALAASRLGLPQPPNTLAGAHQTRSMTGSYHFGHTADPIYMGSCNGAFSFCSMAGYAFESQCHTGERCVYDVVTDKGWRVSMSYHSIRTVIKYVIKDYDSVPECAPEPECEDCFAWKYFNSNTSTSTTTTKSSSKSTKTRTRTSTCKTPGWWGCLDETTTTTSSTTSTSSATTTTTTTTTTCKTPGWFGRCLDEKTTTAIAPHTPRDPATATATSPADAETPSRPGITNTQPPATVAPRPSAAPYPEI